ncbi:hypothetical protein F2P79_023764 [Pimephales promelas]|nr:hypothetical protein F2P79_023764 [Pimephales promelas]KAG1928134.1 hypothetical protein F2P79_023764 [Pimephales promelas]
MSSIMDARCSLPPRDTENHKPAEVAARAQQRAHHHPHIGPHRTTPATGTAQHSINSSPAMETQRQQFAHPVRELNTHNLQIMSDMGDTLRITIRGVSQARTRSCGPEGNEYQPEH